MEQEILRLYSEGFSTLQIAKRVGLSISGVARYKRKHGITPKNNRRTDFEVLEAQKLLSEGRSYAEVGRQIGRPKSTVFQWVRDGALRREKVLPSELSLNEYCRQRTADPIYRSAFTRIVKQRALLEGYWKEECSACGLVDWLGKPPPLEVDHIDGDFTNNLLENLRLICRNCHYYTDTWGNKSRVMVR